MKRANTCLSSYLSARESSKWYHFFPQLVILTQQKKKDLQNLKTRDFNVLFNFY